MRLTQDLGHEPFPMTLHMRLLTALLALLVSLPALAQGTGAGYAPPSRPDNAGPDWVPPCTVGKDGERPRSGEATLLFRELHAGYGLDIWHSDRHPIGAVQVVFDEEVTGPWGRLGVEDGPNRFSTYTVHFLDDCRVRMDYPYANEFAQGVLGSDFERSGYNGVIFYVVASPEGHGYQIQFHVDTDDLARRTGRTPMRPGDYAYYEDLEQVQQAFLSRAPRAGSGPPSLALQISPDR